MPCRWEGGEVGYFEDSQNFAHVRRTVTEQASAPKAGSGGGEAGELNTISGRVFCRRRLQGTPTTADTHKNKSSPKQDLPSRDRGGCCAVVAAPALGVFTAEGGATRDGRGART